MGAKHLADGCRLAVEVFFGFCVAQYSRGSHDNQNSGQDIKHSTEIDLNICPRDKPKDEKL